MDIFKTATTDAGLSNDEIASALAQSLEGRTFTNKKVLIIPPDFTRYHSNAGFITCVYWKLLFLNREVGKEEQESLISTPFTLDWIEWCVDFLDTFLVLFQDAQYVFIYSICQIHFGGGYLSWHSGAFK